MVDECTKKTLNNIPVLRTRAGPRDKDAWLQRLKEEYQALIKVKRIKADNYIVRPEKCIDSWALDSQLQSLKAFILLQPL